MELIISPLKSEIQYYFELSTSEIKLIDERLLRAVQAPGKYERVTEVKKVLKSINIILGE